MRIEGYCDYMLKLADLLREDTVLVRASASEWKDAFTKAGVLLLNAGSIEPRYISAIIDYSRKYNAYIVVAPGIAFPHARPEDGGERLCFSLVTLKEPVYFGHKDHDPVDIFVAFGAVDKTSHLMALAQLAQLFQDQDALWRIRSAERKSEILEVLKMFA